jgi:hypothetical protein
MELMQSSELHQLLRQREMFPLVVAIGAVLEPPPSTAPLTTVRVVCEPIEATSDFLDYLHPRVVEGRVELRLRPGRFPEPDWDY